jgi:hypothetical protein
MCWASGFDVSLRAIHANHGSIYKAQALRMFGAYRRERTVD